MSVLSREMRSGKMLRASCIVIVEKPSLKLRFLMSTSTRARHALPVDAGVLVEALVFGDDERVADERRDVGDLDERAPLEPELGDEAAVGGVELRRLVRLVVVERARPADSGRRGRPSPSSHRRSRRRRQPKKQNVSSKVRVNRGCRCTEAFDVNGNVGHMAFDSLLLSIFVPCDLMRCSTT